MTGNHAAIKIFVLVQQLWPVYSGFSQQLLHMHNKNSASTEQIVEHLFKNSSGFIIENICENPSTFPINCSEMEVSGIVKCVIISQFKVEEAKKSH